MKNSMSVFRERQHQSNEPEPWLRARSVSRGAAGQDACLRGWGSTPCMAKRKEGQGGGGGKGCKGVWASPAGCGFSLSWPWEAPGGDQAQIRALGWQVTQSPRSQLPVLKWYMSQFQHLGIGSRM